MFESPSAFLAGMIRTLVLVHYQAASQKKGLITAGVKVKLNNSSPFFASICFGHYLFLKNILIQPSWMSFLYGTYVFSG